MTAAAPCSFRSEDGDEGAEERVDGHESEAEDQDPEDAPQARAVVRVGGVDRGLRLVVDRPGADPAAGRLADLEPAVGLRDVSPHAVPAS
jgi:hypothetical protein